MPVKLYIKSKHFLLTIIEKSTKNDLDIISEQGLQILFNLLKNFSLKKESELIYSVLDYFLKIEVSLIMRLIFNLNEDQILEC